MLFGRVIARKSLKYHFIVFGVVARGVRGGHFRRVSEAGTRLLVAGDRAFNILPRWPFGGAKIVATKPEVNGTVLSQNSPIAIENNITLAVLIGTTMKIAMVIARRA